MASVVDHGILAKMITGLQAFVRSLWTSHRPMPALELERIFELDHDSILSEGERFQLLLHRSCGQGGVKLYVTEPDQRRRFVSVAIDAGQVGMANSLASGWKLSEYFPSLKSTATRERFVRIVRQGKAHLAATMCGQKTEYHCAILEELVTTRQIKLAREVREIFVTGFPESPAVSFKIPQHLTGT